MLPNDPHKVSPRKARRQFLEDKRNRLVYSSFRVYKAPTRHFVQYCENHGIHTMGAVTRGVVNDWKRNRETDEIAPATFKSNVKHVKTFLTWCYRNEVLADPISEMVENPTVNGEDVSKDWYTRDRAEIILDYLDTYEYASRNHTHFALLWSIGSRVSGSLALDLGDIEWNPADPNVPDGYAILKIRHRPETGTRLKNKEDSERNVTISAEMADLLRDYIDGRRIDVTDENGREPLFTTEHGRLQRQRAYKNFTGLSRPCVYDNQCPHDRDIDECEAALKRYASKCPSSKALHAIRHGSVTNHLNDGWDMETLSVRVDMSIEVMKKHYDKRTLEDKRKKTNKYLHLL
jgi:site-specific recombinase XerD